MSGEMNWNSCLHEMLVEKSRMILYTLKFLRNADNYRFGYINEEI